MRWKSNRSSTAYIIRRNMVAAIAPSVEVNADIAANTCPCRQHRFSQSLEPATSLRSLHFPFQFFLGQMPYIFALDHVDQMFTDIAGMIADSFQ